MFQPGDRVSATYKDIEYQGVVSHVVRDEHGEEIVYLADPQTGHILLACGDLTGIPIRHLPPAPRPKPRTYYPSLKSHLP